MKRLSKAPLTRLLLFSNSSSEDLCYQTFQWPVRLFPSIEQPFSPGIILWWEIHADINKSFEAHPNWQMCCAREPAERCQTDPLNRLCDKQLEFWTNQPVLDEACCNRQVRSPTRWQHQSNSWNRCRLIQWMWREPFAVQIPIGSVFCSLIIGLLSILYQY